MCVLPVPELALLFGMTSAVTDRAQVSFDVAFGGVVVFCLWQSAHVEQTLHCPFPYMAIRTESFK